MLHFQVFLLLFCFDFFLAVFRILSASLDGLSSVQECCHCTWQARVEGDGQVIGVSVELAER